MILTVIGFKGGVAKTTTAIHLAGYLSNHGPTLLVDGDPNRSATLWAKSGPPPQFTVVDEREAVRHAPSHKHIVFDTMARPEREDLAALARGCDLLVVPTTPDSYALAALMLMLDDLKQLQVNNYRVLLTIIPPRPNRDGEEARTDLTSRAIPLFQTGISRFIAFSKAAVNGVLVHQTNDPMGERAWNEYAAIGKEILT